jgi:peptidoglycan hydrolase-like protein with peptidoglycan-binding domain
MHRCPLDRPSFWAATIVFLALSAGACNRGPAGETTSHEEHGDVYVQGQPDDPAAEAIVAADGDTSWRQVVRLDTATLRDSAGSPEQWEQISSESVNSSPMHVPLYGEVAGPSVLRLQVLLDRALFSPGIIDGRWGGNTEKALYWLQQREGLPATARLDQVTFERLVQLAGTPREIARQHQLGAEDIAGPFIDLPPLKGDAIYEVARKPCTCYESLGEKLSEMFHVTPEVLAKLNPETSIDSLRAGDRIWVPNVRDASAPALGAVAQLVVSDRGRYLHAVDSAQRILYHFPTTVGASYDPSPRGNYKVTAIKENPIWHFQPDLLAKVPDYKADARIPAGPNNAVGVVWMALSAPHYGIHGTNSPETIGYTSSAGCVRLTNWDVLFLAKRIQPGVRVSFRDTKREAQTASAATTTSGEVPARR